MACCASSCPSSPRPRCCALPALCHAHRAARTAPHTQPPACLSLPPALQAHLKYRGLDLVNGTVIDTLAAGCLEPALAKVKALRFATEAAITILRIDDYIKINPEQDPRQGGR